MKKGDIPRELKEEKLFYSWFAIADCDAQIFVAGVGRSLANDRLRIFWGDDLRLEGDDLASDLYSSPRGANFL